MKHGQRVLLSVIALGSFIVTPEVFGQQGAVGGEWGSEEVRRIIPL